MLWEAEPWHAVWSVKPSRHCSKSLRLSNGQRLLQQGTVGGLVLITIPFLGGSLYRVIVEYTPKLLLIITAPIVSEAPPPRKLETLSCMSPQSLRGTIIQSPEASSPPNVKRRSDVRRLHSIQWTHAEELTLSCHCRDTFCDHRLFFLAVAS